MLSRAPIPLLIVLNLAVFAQVRQFEFIDFDDNLYVTDNPYVLAGITSEGIAYAFSTEPAPMSNPLTLVSHMADVELFGVDPGAHHLSSLFLHVINTLLLFAVFNRMTRKPGACLFIAALFAIHPLHVETVVWVSDRKDLLSTVFGLLMFWTYLEYAENRRISSLVLACVLYALSLLAKPMAVTLPFVLLLLDAWPLRRLRSRADILKLLLEKVPLFLLTALGCIGTLYLQHSGGATADLEEFSIGSRISNALAAYGIYIRQTVWPFGLGIMYPAPAGGAPGSHALAGAAALAALLTAAVLTRRSMPWIGVGVFWFLGMLVPVIGLVQVGGQLHADRYTYLPIVGLFIAVAFTAAHRIDSSSNTQRRLAVAVAALLVAALAWRAHDQTSNWRNSEILFTHTLDVAGESLLLRNNLGNYYMDRAMTAKAKDQYLKAAALKPGHVLPNYNLARLERNERQFSEAVKRLEPLAERYPRKTDVRLLLTEVLMQSDNLEEAAAHAEVARTLKNGDPKASVLLGLCYERLGRTAQADEVFLEVTDSYPDDANAHVTYANFLARSRRLQDAFPYYDRALKLAPKDATIHYNVGAAFEGAGAREQAIAAYERAISLEPTLWEAHYRLEALKDPAAETIPPVREFNVPN